MRSELIVLGFLSLAPAMASAQPAISAVLNAAFFDAVVSPGATSSAFPPTA